MEHNMKRKDLINRLCNTIALMGGKDDIIDIVRNIDSDDQDNVFEELGKWNSQKIDEINNRLDRCTTQAVSIRHYN